MGLPYGVNHLAMPFSMQGSSTRAIWMSTILIVANNVLIRHSFRDIVRGQFPSVRVEDAGDEKEAIEKTQALRPSLIFMDIKVPGGKGLYLCKRLKSRMPPTTIAMITPYDIPEYRAAAVASGASFVLATCSSSRKEILDIVEAVLEEK
jgi:DNA-binding NarL/FixJ family response regulator